MKKFFLLFIFLAAAAQIAFGQIKFDEYERTDSDSESARIDNFLVALTQEPENKGLIVIYSGDNKERLGNILAFIEGVKLHLRFRKFDAERISFLIAGGKQTLFKEMWLVPATGGRNPQIEPIELNLNNLTGKYLYGWSCLDCEPVIPHLSNERKALTLYAEELKNNKNYHALIVVAEGTLPDGERSGFLKPKNYARDLRKALVEEWKIDSRRVRIEFVKKAKGDFMTAAGFYIIPESKR